MKTFAATLIGLSLMIGTVMAQTPAPSGSTDTTTVKKHKKHNKTSPAPSTSTTPSTPAK
jgi:hypothetical protein